MYIFHRIVTTNYIVSLEHGLGFKKMRSLKTKHEIRNKNTMMREILKISWNHLFPQGTDSKNKDNPPQQKTPELAVGYNYKS